MLCENGETEKVSRRFNTSDILDKREGLGSVQVPSSKYGDGQIILNTFDSARENTLGTASQPGGFVDGKILERLEFIENAYLDYVQHHQQQLELSLIKSKEHEAVFKEAIQALKQEIHNLASGSEK